MNKKIVRMSSVSQNKYENEKLIESERSIKLNFNNSPSPHYNISSDTLHGSVRLLIRCNLYPGTSHRTMEHRKGSLLVHAARFLGPISVFVLLLRQSRLCDQIINQKLSFYSILESESEKKQTKKLPRRGENEA